MKNGDKVKDIISGFTGVMVARTEWLNGCNRIAIQSENFDCMKAPIPEQWFDEQQVVVIKAGEVCARRKALKVETPLKNKAKDRLGMGGGGGPRNDPSSSGGDETVGSEYP